jgi:hypothetical protein
LTELLLQALADHASEHIRWPARREGVDGAHRLGRPDLPQGSTTRQHEQQH